MPRLPRVDMEGILYYVTSKSGHNETLFVEDADYKNYLSLIDTYKRQYGFKLFSYVLMPSHLHLLIELKKNTSISNIMHDLNSLYTKNFNSKYKKKGHLFQERFKTLLAEKTPYLLPLTRYIHWHPKRAKIVEDPKDYPYSSHFKFLEPEKREYPDMRMEIEEVFRILNGREKAFEEYVKDIPFQEINEFKRFIHRKRILGSKEFKEKIERRIKETIEEQKRAQRPRRQPVIYIILSATAILILGVGLFYSYKARKNLRTEYDKTLAFYDKTLEMLKKERDKALKANKDVEKYVWKIRLTEQVVEDLKREREEALRLQKELDGYSWEIKLTQTDGPPMNYNPIDVLTIKGHQVASRNLMSIGFGRSRYSKRINKEGTVEWETIQNDGKGGRAIWRGEWDGKVMKGVFRRRWPDGTVRDFSFISVGERRR